MSVINFLYNSENILIQSNPNEILSSIYNQFCVKANVKRANVNFLCNGQTLDEKITEDKIPKTLDNKKLIVVVDITPNPNQISDNQILIRSKEIICPKCKESGVITMDDKYNIIVDNCKNGHKSNNLSISEFEITQNIDISKIICEICKNNNMGNVYNNEFYRCINCKMNLCPLCKKIRHFSNHIFINYENKNFICQDHGEPYISYCNDCLINLCYICEEKHFKHNITDFKKLRKNKEDLEKAILSIREYINKAKQIVDADIKNYKNRWNKIIQNYEIIYKIKKDIFECLEKGQRNLQNLINQNFIIKNLEQDLNSIINANNIIDRYKNVLKIYEKMENENIIRQTEYKNDIIIKYKINNKNKIRIFGEEFVSNNKDNCQIIYEYKKYKLSEYFKFNNPENNIFEIILTGINNIKDASFMFYDCDSLISLPDISEWNTINVINMNSMFQYCSSLETLPDISKWDTTNVTEMNYMFAHCSSLKSIPDISKWNLINTTDKRNMFIGCSPSLIIPKIVE